MELMNQYYVYLMTNRTKTLYTGVTSDLLRRVDEHKLKSVPGFTAKYNITKLVYYETTTDIYSAIAREKQIKGWLRVTGRRRAQDVFKRFIILKRTLSACHPDRPKGEKDLVFPGVDGTEICCESATRLLSV